MSRSAPLAVTLLLQVACHAPAVNTSPQPVADGSQIAAHLDTLAPQWLAAHKVPSLAVALIRHGQVQFTRVYGEQSPGVAATLETRYNVASLTKPVFAETILRLVAAGVLSLDAPLDSLWIDPDIAADPRHALLTPRIALSHRTGFANWRRESAGVLKFTFDPGARFGYSGEGFEYLRRAAEKRTSLPLETLAQREVFALFGMSQTGWAMRPEFSGHLAAPSGPNGARREPSVLATANAADELRTTIGDYARFVAGVMNGRDLPRALATQRDSMEVIDPQGTQPCRARTNPRCPLRGGYGLGWSVLEFDGETVLWHTGSDWGERTMVFYVPSRREGAVLFTNSADGFKVIIEAGMLLVAGSPFADFLRSGK